MAALTQYTKSLSLLHKSPKFNENRFFYHKIDTADTLTFTGDPIFEYGLLDFSIGGFEPDTHDILNIVDSTLDLLGGNISLSPLGDFDILAALTPGESKTLSFLKAEGGILNVLSTVDVSQLDKPGLLLDVAQQGNELVLTASRSLSEEPPNTVPPNTDLPKTNPIEPPTLMPPISSPKTTDRPEPSLVGGVALLGLLGLRKKRVVSRQN